MTRRNVATGLLVVGFVMLLAVVPLWIAATQKADDEQRVNDYAEAITGIPQPDADADRGIPLAVGAVGALVFLSGVIVAVSMTLVSPSPDS